MNLWRANLKGANLIRANLIRANLQGTVGLTASQVHAARRWAKALYSDDFLTELGLPSDHNQMECSLFFSAPTWCHELLDQR